MSNHFTLLLFAFSISGVFGHLEAFATPSALPDSSNPPFFTTNIPDTLTVSCLANVPPAPRLEADDDEGPPNFPRFVDPVDNPPASSINACNGGQIMRTWTVTDSDNNTTVRTQVIIIQADNAPPVTTATIRNDTFACGSVNYSAWLSGTQLAFLTNTTDNCSAVGSGLTFSNNAPASLPPGCTTTTITFTARDACLNSLNWVARITIVDDTPPVIIGVPPTDTVDCDMPLPPLPQVSATDECPGNIEITFSEVSNQSADSTSCAYYKYEVLRTWRATDICGNMAVSTQTIRVVNNTAPDFVRPPNIAINCNQNPEDLSLTGDVTQITANCAPQLATVSFQDVVTPGNCPGNYSIQRIWRVRDVCNNTTIKIQTITVIDNQPPTFELPPNLIINCNEDASPSNTGEPFAIQDNCQSSGFEVSSQDVILPGGCINGYVLRRTWTVTDSCGNAASLSQLITITDQVSPVIQQSAEDRTVFCTSADNYTVAFNQWIAAHGNAAATDNCTFANDMSWIALDPLSGDPVALPDVVCPSVDSILMRQQVLFVAIDECGNRDSTLAQFTVIDIQAPQIIACGLSQPISTDPGLCEANVVLPMPLIEEDCGFGVLSETAIHEQPIVSDAAPGQEGLTPVNPIELRIPIGLPLPINATNPAILSISLLNADAEAPTEYFNIFNENGDLLGTTALTAVQCGNSTRDFQISPQQLNAWALDGFVTIRLSPNIPPNLSGAFAINAVCALQGIVRGSLNYSTRDLSGLQVTYRIDGGQTDTLNIQSPASVRLEVGAHQVTYFVSDCAGNQSSCTSTLLIEDSEAPSLTCPADLEAIAPSGACSATVTLPLPPGISDNCGLGYLYEQTQPLQDSNALWQFVYDPNLNDYLAQPKTYTFSGLGANAVGDATLRLRARGDFSSNRATFKIFGEDNSIIGTSMQGFALCDAASSFVLTISKDNFNAWAADGALIIRIEPDPIPVPPGVPGDGINPCDPSAISADGDSDGISFLYADITYQRLDEIQYFSEGATNLPLANYPFPTTALQHDFRVGTSEVFFVVKDIVGNPDTCSFLVVVRDNEAPVALCQPSIVYINPSGVVNQEIPASAIDAGSSDNCGIASRILSPSTFNCLQAGGIFPISMTVADSSGNMASCTTTIRIEIENPQPSASTEICRGDTLFLFANPPAAQGGILYSFQWSGPQGFVSNLENPFIANIDPARSGSYSVTITGVTGCVAVGTVEVAIEDLPLVPALLTSTNICTNNDIVLNSGVTMVNPNGRYNWYEGLPPFGSLIASTSVPQLILPGPLAPGQRSFYLTLESGPCRTAPSPPVPVTINIIPSAFVNEEQITLCEGQPLILGTTVSGPGITYEWNGPNFSSANQMPVVADSARLGVGGIYTLRVTRNGCTSAPDTTTVTLLPRPALPVLLSSGPACEGSSVLLTASGSMGTLYRWFPPVGSPIVTSANVLFLQNINESISGNWRVSATRFGCTSELSLPLNVVVHPLPQASAEALQSPICEGQSLQLYAFPELVNAQYLWTGPGGYASGQRSPIIPSITPARAGNYVVTITSAEGCSATASVSVGVLGRPTINGLSNLAPSCISAPTSIPLTASISPPDNGTYTYEWSGPCPVMSSGASAEIPGATISCNGQYQLIVRNEAGCASLPATTFVNLANTPATPAIPSISSGNTGVVCAGQSISLSTTTYTGNSVTYFWQTPAGLIPSNSPSIPINNASVADGGLYSVFVQVDGCTSSPSGQVNLTVNPVPSITSSSNSPVCEGQNIQFNTSFIPGATYNWTGLDNGFSASISNPSISNANIALHAGRYVVVATLNGCNSEVDTIQMEIRALPLIPEALDVAPVCISTPGTSAAFSLNPASATSGAVYEWFDRNNALVGSSGDLNFSFQNFTTYGEGTFLFSVRAKKDGCISTARDSVYVTFNTIPSQAAFAGFDTLVCPNLDVFLGAATPPRGSGLWSLQQGGTGNEVIESPELPNSRVSGLIPGSNYLFRWTLSNGACQNYAFDEIEMSVRALEAALAGQDTLICPMTPFNLYANPVNIATGRWSQPDIQAQLGVGIVNPADPASAITGLTRGNLYVFSWTLEDACGARTDIVQVAVSDVPAIAGPDFRACNDEEFAVLQARPLGIGSTGFWSAQDSALVFSDRSDPEAMVSGLREGFNTVVWTVDNALCGLAARDTVVVEYSPNPQAEPDVFSVPFGEQSVLDVLANDFVPANTTIRVIASPQNGNATVVSGNILTYTPGINFIGTDQLTYEICSDGCECAIATVQIDVNADDLCKIPTVITPNGDNINDVFVVPCLLDNRVFPNSQLVVFNRWGDEVYRSAIPYQNNWGGTYNGVILPSGNYFYLLNFGDGSTPRHGYFMILQ